MTEAPAADTTPEPAGSAPSRPMRLVVDAGVAIKWYVPEVHEAEAKRFLWVADPI